VLAAFVGTVLGGLGSLRGAVIGGFAFGVIVTALQSYLPSAILPYRDAISFALVIALIMLRPHGLAKDPSVTLERA
jgi:branched-chain amino acid transport system permease protein